MILVVCWQLTSLMATKVLKVFIYIEAVIPHQRHHAASFVILFITLAATLNPLSVSIWSILHEFFSAYFEHISTATVYNLAELFVTF